MEVKAASQDEQKKEKLKALYYLLTLKIWKQLLILLIICQIF